MIQEREEKLNEIEKLNGLLNPKNFIAYKKELEEKYEYLKLVEIKDLGKEIEKEMIKLQKIVLRCYKVKIKQIENKSEIIDMLYEFRYYMTLPFDQNNNINEIKEIQKEITETRKALLDKAQALKIFIELSKNKEITDGILKNIFDTRIISLEDIYIKLTKEKDKFYVQLFDEDVFEEKIELENFGNINKKDLEIKLNKKIKIFE